MNTYGLLGKNISYSFSHKFFNEKFVKENIAATYKNFDIATIEELQHILQQTPNLKGLNVTIPYKETVLPFLDQIDPTAEAIGAVNTIKISQGKLIGHNTDVYGFLKSIHDLLSPHHKKALVLGTGGASKAVVYGLEKTGIQTTYVSRKHIENGYTYAELNRAIINDYQIIINCTPLGTFPNTNSFPELPYSFLGNRHLLYDLTYNPPLTQFLAKGQAQGAKICNGQQMLEWQALKAWEIWNTL